MIHQSSINRNERPQGRRELTPMDIHQLKAELMFLEREVRRLSDRKWYIKKTLKAHE